MRIDFGPLGADGGVDIAHTVAAGSDKVDGLSKQYLAVYVECLCRAVREMIADIAHIGCTQQGVADGMDEHVGIAMAQKSHGVRNTDTAKPQFAIGHQPVDVETHTYSNLCHNI